MSDWKGQSRGTLIGHKIFVFIILRLGFYPAYALLVPVVAYFAFFSGKPSKSNYVFFRKRLGYPRLKVFLNMYKTFWVFGKIMIDRVAIASGQRRKFTFEFDGIEHIKNLLQSKTGGLIFTAHIGNINIARYFFEEIDSNSKINMVVTDLEHQGIKEFLKSIEVSKMKFIVAQEDMGHVFQIDKALKNNEIIVLAADRQLENRKNLSMDFLGKQANFFYGPFEIAARKNLPVVFAHVMKEPKLHYHFYARPCPEFSTSRELLESYRDNLEGMVKKYPNQWFNFYDYWGGVDSGKG